MIGHPTIHRIDPQGVMVGKVSRRSTGGSTIVVGVEEIESFVVLVVLAEGVR